MDEIGVDEGLQILRGGTIVGVDDADDAQAGIFHKTLVSITQAIPYDRPNAANHREVLRRHISATVRGSLKSRPLDCDGEEVEVIEQGG